MTLLNLRYLQVSLFLWDTWALRAYRSCLGRRPIWLELGPLQVRIGRYAG